ncbi:hypothetical protein LX36DRAFT_647940 [Colletotrichum falcatum]|nr:hypothetical protein LX36DRAFT_647940 [Colletotrichum falcatum]
MSLATDSELFKMAGDRSKAYHYGENRIEAQVKKLDARKILDDMVDESTCSICYVPLRSMHVTHCGHSHCTLCISWQFEVTGTRRSVPCDSLGHEQKAMIFARCPTCRVEIGLDVNEEDRPIVPFSVAAEKQLARLREWSQLRVDDAAHLWRRPAETGAYDKTRSVKAEDKTRYFSFEGYPPTDREDARRGSSAAAHTVTSGDRVTYRDRFPGRQLETPPAPRPTTSTPPLFSYLQNAAYSTPTTGMASPSEETLYHSVGYQPGYCSLQGFVPPTYYHHPAPPTMRRKDESFMDSIDERKAELPLRPR